MEPPTEIPKKKLKLDGMDVAVAQEAKELDNDDIASIDSSHLGEDRRILCQVIMWIAMSMPVLCFALKGESCIRYVFKSN